MGMFGTEYATTENKFVEFKQLQKQMDIKILEENEKFNSDAQCLAQTNVTMDLQKDYFKLPTIALGNYKHCPLYEYLYTVKADLHVALLPALFLFLWESTCRRMHVSTIKIVYDTCR